MWGNPPPSSSGAHGMVKMEAGASERGPLTGRRSCMYCTIDTAPEIPPGSLTTAVQSPTDPDQCQVCFVMMALRLLPIQVAPQSKALEFLPSPGTIEWQRLRTVFVNISKQLGAVSPDALVSAWGTMPRTPPGPPPQSAPRTPPRGQPLQGLPALEHPAGSSVAVSLPVGAVRQAPMPSMPATTPTTATNPTAGDATGQAAGAPQVDRAEFIVGMPLSAYSLTARFPTGVVFAPIARMRDTANEYTNRLCLLDWFVEFRLATVQALQRRLTARAPAVVGKSNVDLEVGFLQIQARVNAIIGLYKGLRSWIDSQKDDGLDEILPHAQVLLDYFNTMKTTIAADTGMVLQFALFREHFAKSGGNVVTSMQALDFERLSTQHAEVLQAEQSHRHEEEESQATSVPALGGSDLGVEGEADGETKRGSAVRKTLSDSQIAVFKARTLRTPVENFAKLVSDAIASKLYTTNGESIKEPTVLNPFIEELIQVRAQWRLTTGCDDKDEFFMFLGIVVDLFGCLCSDAKKPSVPLARSARSNVYSTMRSNTPSGDLAKAIGSFASGKAALEAALTHSRMGLEDEAATATLTTTVDDFESMLEPAFAQQSSWPISGNHGGRHTFSSIAPFIDSVRTTATALFGALNRWSAMALDENKNLVENTISNFALILHISNWVMLDSCMEAFSRCLPNCVVEAVLTDGVGGGDERVGHEAPAQGAPEEASGADMDQSTNEGKLWRDLVRHIGGSIDSFKSAATPFCAALESSVNDIMHCLEAVEQRTPTDWWSEDFSAGEQMVCLSEEFARNRTSLEKSFDYLVSLSALADGDGPTDAYDDGTGSRVASTHLCRFARIHREHLLAIAPLHFELAEGICEEASATTLGSLLDTLIVDIGEGAYSELCKTSLERYMASVTSCAVGLCHVHGHVLRDAEPANMLGLLITKESIQMISATVHVDFNASAEAAWNQLLNLGHNTAIVELEKFADAIAINKVSVPGVMDQQGAPSTLPLADALLFLQLSAGMTNLSIPAIFIDEVLLNPHGDHSLNITTLCGSTTNALSIMKNAFDQYDSMVDSPHTFRLEGSGRRWPTSFVSMREWVKLVGIYFERCLATALQMMAKLLNEATTACKSCIPSWRACFSDDGRLLEDMAERLLGDSSLKQLVAAHNSVHGILTMMNNAGGILKIDPKLQKNPHTAADIAAATDTLAASSLASVAMMGIDLLSNSRSRPDAATKAQSFITKHKNSGVSSSLPAGFWTELHLLASHATPPSLVPIAAATSSTTHAPSDDGASMASTPKTKGGPAPKSEAASDLAPKVSPFKREADGETTLPAFKRSRR